MDKNKKGEEIERIILSRGEAGAGDREKVTGGGWGVAWALMRPPIMVRGRCVAAVEGRGGWGDGGSGGGGGVMGVGGGLGGWGGGGGVVWREGGVGGGGGLGGSGG
jgi:hypothetical protein